MNIRKKILTVAAFSTLVAFSTSIWAQAPNDDGKKEHRIERRVEKMKEKLNLTDAQTTQVKAILEQARPQMKADIEKMKAAPKDQRLALREQMQKDRSETKDKLLAVLNPEQRTKAEKFMKRHEHGKHFEKKEAK
ncbi:MAG: Spy/CpxP family protein refolding chaperone [Bacteroidota bacterium]|nr:Spy/CpxP family protein refolding chaperone [Bacteroidota bacterium]MDP4230536.1 Spy/CpxP family protein refolding chaperone [Bacteroidota bacterium]MDP4236127.1 Spy/CpxP family protein refolding chaperone [Bacteroidota bacterium]